MNLFWSIMGFVALVIYLIISTAKLPLKAWKATIKRNLKDDLNIYLTSIFMQLVVSVGWWQTGFDDIIKYSAQFFGQTYDQYFFPKGQLNFLLALIGLLMHFLINMIWKKIQKPHEEK